LSALEKLAAAGGSRLAPPILGTPDLEEAEPLRTLLTLKNGFFAFDGALHVLPVSRNHNLSWWNSATGWRSTYPANIPDVFGFALDAFGGQFGLLGGEVVYLNPELGEPEPLAGSVEAWAAMVLEDPSLVGHSAVEKWQADHGPLREEQRLVPLVPFVLGGAMTNDNLRVCNTWEATQRYGRLALVLRSLPDGAAIHRGMLSDWLAPMAG
jgi:hypothetical protein